MGKECVLDIAIVGGGIVGAATARQLLLRWPRLSCALLEKEQQLSLHQTGRNSGVIHAGIYYQPGSLKARLCVSGARQLYEYCDAKGIFYKRCGKLIVATDAEQVARLQGIYERGLSNKVPGLRLLNSLEEIKEIEPNCVGLAAVYSPNTGIVDYAEVTRQLANEFVQLGGSVQCGFALSGVQVLDGAKLLKLQSAGGESLLCRRLITCAGLHSDRVARLTQQQQQQQQQQQMPAIVPFRGDYLMLRPEKRQLVRGNIYPVPDPRFPFLGVHFTPRVDGGVWLGPNAVLSLKREGYGRFDLDLDDAAEALAHRGLRQLALRHWRQGVHELYGVISKAATVRSLQKFVPELTVSDVVRGPSGVRAQAIDDNGGLVDDFVIESCEQQVLHVCNAPSPAATSALAIAEHVADQAASRLRIS